MERRHKIMFAFLGVLVAVALYQNIGFLKGGKPKSRRVATPIASPKPAPAPVAPREEAEETERRATSFSPIPIDPSRLQSLLAKGAWGREPFLTVEELRAPKVAPGGFPVTLEEVAAISTLSAILVSEGQRVAIINNERYTVGESLPSGDKIVDITPEGVSLESGRMLRLRESPIQIKSRER